MLRGYVSINADLAATASRFCSNLYCQYRCHCVNVGLYLCKGVLIVLNGYAHGYDQLSHGHVITFAQPKRVQLIAKSANHGQPEGNRKKWFYYISRHATKRYVSFSFLPLTLLCPCASNRQHLSCDDFLKGKREGYQITVMCWILSAQHSSGM